MTPRTKKTAAALSGALVLASGAYALGSQAGDGSALAGGASTSNRAGGYGAGFGPGPGKARHLSDLAAKLGVTEAKLRAALQDLRPERRDERRDELAAALAKELGISTDKVEAALDKRPAERKLKRHRRFGEMRDAFADQLAGKLGVDEAKVRAALDDVRPDGRGGKPDLGDLATKLGVSEAKLRSALQDLRPRIHRRGGPGAPDERAKKIDGLANELGVSEARLRAAFKNLRDEMMKQHEARRDAFAAELAAKLGISEAKVNEVIDSLGHHGRRGP